MRAGELAFPELVGTVQARIDRHDARVKAWVVVKHDQALSQAEQVAGGKALCGITVGVKDIIDVAGLPTLAASPLRPNVASQRDAEIVRRLRDAGAVILGKTVTTEWAFLDPPPTCNPWNLERTPGGSSSGSAAAVAARMCHVALGTQTGGSVIRPAAFCGLFGYMFAPGELPSEGILPLAPTLDRPGVMSADLSDLQRVVSAITSTPFSSHVEDRQSIGVIRQPWLANADDEVRQAFDVAVAKLPVQLHELGVAAELVDVDLTQEFDGVAQAHLSVMAYESANVHRAAFEGEPDKFGKRIRELIETGLSTSQPEYQQALGRLEAWQQAIHRETAQGRLLLTPAAPTPAPAKETTGDPSFNSPWTAAGTPVLTAPVGLSADGLPLGIQLIGAAGGEHRLFQMAKCWEAGIGLPPAFRD